jgi:hypothetical protein
MKNDSTFITITSSKYIGKKNFATGTKIPPYRFYSHFSRNTSYCNRYRNDGAYVKISQPVCKGISAMGNCSDIQWQRTTKNPHLHSKQKLAHSLEL